MQYISVKHGREEWRVHTYRSVDPEAEMAYRYKHESLVKSARYESLQSIKCGIRRRGSSCLPAMELWGH